MRNGAHCWQLTDQKRTGEAGLLILVLIIVKNMRWRYSMTVGRRERNRGDRIRSDCIQQCPNICKRFPPDVLLVRNILAISADAFVLLLAPCSPGTHVSLSSRALLSESYVYGLCTSHEGITLPHMVEMCV